MKISVRIVLCFIILVSDLLFGAEPHRSFPANLLNLPIDTANNAHPLVSRWPADGNANDSKGSNTGTLHGGTSFTSGVTNMAFQFDGIDDYVSAGTSDFPTGNSNRTLMMWARIDQMRANVAFFAGYGAFGKERKLFQLGGVGRDWIAKNDALFFFTQGDNALIAPPQSRIKHGVWYHFAVTNKGEEISLYMNGVMVIKDKGFPMQTPVNTKFYIGRIPGPLGEDKRINGAVDDVRIYDRALSASEIHKIYEGSKP